MITREQISEWFDDGVAVRGTHMLIVCMQMTIEGVNGFTFRPHYCASADECTDALQRCAEARTEYVIEVYDLTKDRDEQVAQHWVWNVPT